MTDQADIINFIDNPENINKAVEGSMDKRNKVLSHNKVTDLLNEDSKPSTGYSKAQSIAEYKQLLNELPPDADTADDVDMGDLPHTLPDYYNNAIDQCRALIEARIKELE